MKLLIICSEKSNTQPKNSFEIKTDTRFANTKFIPHLLNKKEVCTVCGKDCFWCRGRYDLDFKEDIVRIIKLPDIYEIFVDNTDDYLPESFQKHDVAIAIGIHQDILVELPKLIKESGGKALIVPCESGEWVSRWTRDEVIERCKRFGLEYAFPKPFCNLSYGKFPIINEFIDKFKIGKPKFKLYVDNNDTIKRAEVIISAPCGNGYNVCKHLVGKKLGDEAKAAVAKFWHSYPCLGGMTIDPEVGDTILHIGGYIHYDALSNAHIVRI
ncbi:MAG: DUF166 family protein [Tepidanaerobacteraceae bacterium]|jgi:hypothetical protein|nr:hypothetical protein [Tepidanaerobacter sp.]HQA59923.1 DUF166 family protein [Tepidanaerobacteraceae bacterium]HQE05053.1 DUF166 family protein [Tepidanaerobacteraceae bacterium]